MGGVISEYFDDWDVNKEFSQEFISLWGGLASSR